MTTTVAIIIAITLLFTLVSIMLNRRQEESAGEYGLTPQPASWEKGGRDLTAPMTVDEREVSLEISKGRSIAIEPTPLSGLTVTPAPDPKALPDTIAAPPGGMELPANSRLRPADAMAPIDDHPALMDDVVRGLEQIPPLPKAAHAVLRELDAAGSSARSVGEIVATDPVIGAAVLRVVNSAANALRRKVLTVKEAVAYLGFANVRSIVMKLKVSQLFRPPSGKTLCYDAEALWQHSMAVAQVADHLAKRTNKADPDLASTLGLLHDIGKLAINSQFPNKVSQLWRPAGLIGGSGESWLARERRLFGADHAFMGAFLAARWRLPEEIADAIRLHHLPPELSLESVAEPVRRAVQVVHVANQLVKYRHVYCADMEIDALNPALLAELGLPEQIEEIFDPKIERAIAAASQMARGVGHGGAEVEETPARASA
ncbi:MAG TPA: HDOD domain-containing protein [Tepidisphaeraceae bacterium]